MIKRFFIASYALFIIACASGHHKPFEEKMAPVRDLAAAQTHIQKTVSSSPYLSLKKIGQVAYDGFQAPLWCVSFRTDAPVAFTVFIDAGIHGNEPAGVAYALQFVEHLAKNPDRYDTIGIDIVPILNPWGWVHDIRYNRNGTDINRDFSTFHSREAKIIADFLNNKQYDLMLDLHEDRFARGFYLYQYGAADKSIAETVVETIKSMGFPIEEKVSMLILEAKNGIIDAPMWGLWYMRLTGQMSIANYYRLSHSRRVYTIETPTKPDKEDRIRMQRAAVEVLIPGHPARAENENRDTY